MKVKVCLQRKLAVFPWFLGLQAHPYVSARTFWGKKNSGKAEKIFAEGLSNFLDNNY
jgi:hypothetical protein